MHWLRFLSFRRPPASSSNRARQVGRRGERVAARHLRRRGYRIYARNLRTPCGEIDLLGEQGGQVVLVEVKARTRRTERPPAHPFRHAQRERQRAAARWLARQAGFKKASFRHDLVMVTFDGRRSLVTIRRDVLNFPGR